MHLVEQALDGFFIAPTEHCKRNIDRHGVLLARIAHVGGAPEGDLLRLDGSACDGGTALVLERAVDLLHIPE